MLLSRIDKGRGSTFEVQIPFDQESFVASLVDIGPVVTKFFFKTFRFCQ